MKPVLKSMLFSAFVMAFSVVTFAQQLPHEDKLTPEERLEKMKTDLNLSDEQVSQIRAILIAEKDRIRTLREEAHKGNADARAKLKTEREAIRAEIDKVLTPEQREQAKVLHAQRKDPKVRAADRTAQLKTELGLNEKQAKEVEAALVDHFTQKQALRDAAGDEKPNRDQMNKLRHALDSKMKDILSEEQFAKLQEYRKKQLGERRGMFHKHDDNE